MAEKKTGAAKHSADYRERKKAEAERFGIETLPVEMAAGNASWNGCGDECPRLQPVARAAAGPAPVVPCL